MNARAVSRPLSVLLPLILMVWGCGDETPSPTALDTFEAQLAKGGGGKGGDPVVKSVVPDEGLQGETVDIEVSGEGFEPGDEVALGIDGDPIDAITTNGTTFVTAEVLTANITIAPNTDVGDYDVIVTGRKGRKGIGTALFKVKLGPHQNAFVTDLGSLEGRSTATDINEAGEIVGWSYSPSDRRAVYWDAVDHQIVDLGPGWAEAINNSGVIVGHFSTPQGRRAFVRDRTGEGSTLVLKPRPGDPESRARDINDVGQVVGVSGSLGSPIGVIWDEMTGQITTELQGLPEGSGSSTPFRLNSEGHVVGVSSDGSGSTQAVIWLDTDDYADPIALTAGADWAYAYGVSDPVDGIVYVAGQRGLSGGYWAALWTVNLSDPSSFTVVDLASSSYAFDVNTEGDVVGRIGENPRAYLWRVSQGAVETVELGGLTGRGSSSARAISSNAGLIVGWSHVSAKGKNKGIEHAVLWEFP